MKKIYLVACCVFCTVALLAQPTLQYPENIPIIGDVLDIQFVSTNGLTPGPSGPDVSWDYSGLTTLYGAQITAIDPTQAPAGNEFPHANIALNIGDTIYTYAQTNADGYFYLGSESTTGTFPSLLIYSDSRTFLKFPFTYDDTYFDTYKGVVTTTMATVHVNAVSEMFADAYGTLTLPGGTYSNVLRIITVDAELDSIFMGGVFTKSFDLVRTQYSWFAPDSRGPLMSIEIISNGGLGTVDTMAYYSSAGSGIGDYNKQAVSGLAVFPNPAEEHIMVTFEVAQDVSGSISIVNQIGQLVINRAIPESALGTVTERIDISSLPSGIYFVNVSCNCGKQLTEKFVIK